MSSSHNNATIRECFRDQDRIGNAMREAVREALRRHMLLGASVAVAGENGEGVRILAPEEIREVLNGE